MDWYLFYLRYHINGVIHCLIGDIFFSCLFTPPFLNRRFLSNRSSSPHYGYGTEETPLGVLRNVKKLMLDSYGIRSSGIFPSK